MALQALEDDLEFLELLDDWGERGVLWIRVINILERLLPEAVSDRKGMARSLVPKALTRLFGPQGQGWSSERNDQGLWVIRINPTARAAFLGRHGRRS